MFAVYTRIPVGANLSAPVQTGPGAHPASCTIGTGSFPGVKRPRCDFDHPSPSSAEVEGRVELYICSLSEPSWPVLSWTYFTYFYWMFQEESAVLRENVSDVKLHRYDQTYLHPKLNGYGDTCEIRCKEWDLLYICILPNMYQKEEGFIVYVMLTAVLIVNIWVT